MYFMTPEQALALAQEDSPIHLPGFYHMLASLMKDEEKITQIYRTGKGMGWHEHEKGLFVGCERFFRPTYLVNLVSTWIPALDGVEAKLKAGALVADIGCGHGASTLLMAKAYPGRVSLALTTMRLPSKPPARKRWRLGERPGGVPGGGIKDVSRGRLRPGGVFRLPA